MEYGIKETKELVAGILEVISIFPKIMEDGKLGLSDLLTLFEKREVLFKAFEGADQIKSEVGDLSEVELRELVAYIQEKFDLENEQVEDAIEKALNIAAEALLLFGIVKKN